VSNLLEDQKAPDAQKALQGDQTKLPEMTSVPDPVPSPRILPGCRLRELREARGLSLVEVSRSLKFSPRQIEALECDDFEKLPGTTVIRGFIRSYAKILKVEAEPLLAMLEQQLPVPPVQIQMPETTGTAMPESGERSQILSLWAGLSAVAVALVALIFYVDWSKWLPKFEKTPHTQEMQPKGLVQVEPPSLVQVEPPLPRIEQPAAIEASTPVAPSPAPSSIDPNMRQMVFDFEGKSWVEVKDGAHRVIFAQINEPGTRQVVIGKPPFSVVIGNAASVKVQYEERLIDLEPHTKVDVARLTVK